MATETTRHLVIRTHNSSGTEIFEPFRMPDNDNYTTEDLDEAKAAATTLNNKHKPHKFAAYTLIKR